MRYGAKNSLKWDGDLFFGAVESMRFRHDKKEYLYVKVLYSDFYLYLCHL